MAPSFFSKFVKQTNGIHSRSSSETPSASTERLSSSEKRTPRAPSPSPAPPAPITSATLSPERTSVYSTISALSAPNVNVVPPSPISAASFPDSSDVESLKTNHTEELPKRSPSPSISKSNPLGLASTTADASDPSTPLATDRNQYIEDMSTKERSRTLMPSSSSSNLKKKKSQDLQNKRSDKSLRSNPPPPIITTSTHGRSSTEGASRTVVNEHGVFENTIPIVESPTAMRGGEFSNTTSEMTPLASSNTFLSTKTMDNDAASIISKNEDGSQKRRTSTWRRGSTNARKPTGLASAIAASGLAMANPGLVNAQQFSPPRSVTSSQRHGRNPSSGSAYLTSSPPGSADFESSRRSLDRNSTHPARKRTGSTTKSSSVTSGDHDTGNYSGLEDSSDDSDGYESDDGLLDDIPADIPVTGFAVASSKRNADFHELFPSVPEGDYLIEDYGCAMQREILIQGRIYISENHVCFHANIFGWITNLVIPIYEILSLEKKMTAFVIPNAILVSTRQNKYTFASFLARDTTYDVIYNIWRLVRPSDGEVSRRPSIDGSLNPSEPGIAVAGNMASSLKPKVTACQCGKDGQHYTETALEIVIPGTPERIYNLMFASGFIKDFMRDNQKLIDIQISDWAPTEPGSKLLARNMSYIKPLNASLGPKSTKCEIRDETVFCDFDDYVSTVTTTRTPDVPSGGVFSVKTRTCITWASAVSTKVLVTTQVDWTGRSFIKGIIEKSAIDGQKVYHNDLDTAIRAYIQEHKSEFIPEGVSLDEAVPAETSVVKDETPAKSTDGRQREHERNQRSLQWALDTFEGAARVAKQSTSGALELVKDAWDQSNSTTILIFVIILLVFSNLWTLTRMGRREEVGRRKELRKVEEKEKWIQGIVATLWDELATVKGVSPEAIGIPKEPIGLAPVQNDVRAEVAALHDALNAVEGRIKNLRQDLSQVDLD